MEKLVEEGTCPVCLEIFSDPQILLCSHNICLSCSKSILKFNSNTSQKGTQTCNNNNNNDNSTNSKDLCCPLCRGTTLETELKPNITLRNMVDMLKHGKGTSTPAQCFRCKAKEATIECKDCYRAEVALLCKECGDIMHQGEFTSHRTGPRNSLPVAHLTRCVQHQKKRSLLCEDDLVLICTHCTFDGHQGHKIVPVGVATKKLMPKVIEQVDILNNNKQLLLKAVQSLNTSIQEDVQQRSTLKLTMETSFNEIRKALDKKQESLNHELTTASSFSDRVILRDDLMRRAAAINDFQLKNLHVETLGDIEVVGHICSLLTLNQNMQIPDGNNYLLHMEANNQETLSQIENFRFVCTQAQGNGSDGVLEVTRRVELDPSRTYSYKSLTVKKGGLLTVSANSPLEIQVQGCVLIEEGGSINLDGKGHPGGPPVAATANGFANQGCSSQGQGEMRKEANGGGGGGGIGSSSFGSTGGGGGGYGTMGQNAATNAYGGKNNPGGVGGNIYGDEGISILHLGSGGGSGHSYTSDTGGTGGNGGGAFRLNAHELRNYGSISCDGGKGGDGAAYGSGGGGGSGGSVHLQAKVFESKGTVTAQGGPGGTNKAPTEPKAFSNGGNGGMGRIRVDTPRNSTPVLGSINPQSYRGVL